MTRTGARLAIVSLSSLFIAAVACGGGVSAGSGSTSSEGESHGSQSTGGMSGGKDGGGCVTVDLTASDLSCSGDPDCSAVFTSFCPGFIPDALCPNTAANATGVAKVKAAIATVPHGEDAGNDFCDAAGQTPRCVQSKCVLCGLGAAACTGASSSTGASSASSRGDYAYCRPLTDAGTLCFAFPLTAGGPSADTVCAADSLDDFTWVSIPSCGLPGLSGCCGMNDTWQCFYGTKDAESTCTSNGGTWSDTSP